jgi:NADH:ubiquinone oxidoreductase subunit
MNYRKIYDNIIENRLKTPFDGYTEKHHIIPKSIGGSDLKENLVCLSAREHFVCHYLLTKMFQPKTKEFYSMIKAFLIMSANSEYQDRYFNSRLYESCRTKFSQAQSFYQKGNKNSQYGTMWIVNLDLRLNKKIKKEQEIPEGWIKGYVTNFDAYLEKIKKVKRVKKIKKEKKEKEFFDYVDYYTRLYKIYNEYGFEYLVENTGYDKSKQNFVMRCAKYVKDFVPQNGKPRGTNKKI